jgi:hypothetical protein
VAKGVYGVGQGRAEGDCSVEAIVSEESLRKDLEEHPELSPLLDVAPDGRIECFGWVSPIYDFPSELLEEKGSEQNDRAKGD